MSGWILSDEADHTYPFPSGFALDPGASVKVHTGSGEDTETDLYWGSGRAVWNNGGDTSTLIDTGGNQVNQKEY
jgi:competence protein ComEC